MRVEVLVVTMEKKDCSLYEKMNIQSNCILANQTNETKIEIFNKNNNICKLVSNQTTGVGKNRNVAMLYATGDILVFADDDMVYVDDYDKILLKAFNENPKADVIVFNLSKSSGRKMIKKQHKVNFFNYMRYGAVRIAVKKSSLDKANICFSNLYGGGAKYSSGEDSLFLCECLKKGLKIYAIPDIIAKLTFERESTWDNGNIEKQAYDKGVLLKNMYPGLSFLLKYVFAFKMKCKNFNYFKILKLINRGIKEFKYD